MKNLNSLKIGKYTFWVSFGIGNLFLIGFLFGAAIKVEDIAIGSAMFSIFYLILATIVNIFILILLCFDISIVKKENRKQYFKGMGIILINIPLAILYSIIGMSLLYSFYGISITF